MDFTESNVQSGVVSLITFFYFLTISVCYYYGVKLKQRFSIMLEHKQIRDYTSKLIDELIPNIDNRILSNLPIEIWYQKPDVLDRTGYAVTHIGKYVKRNVSSYIVNLSNGERTLLRLLPKVSIEQLNRDEISIKVSFTDRRVKPVVKTTTLCDLCVYTSHFNKTVIPNKETKNVKIINSGTTSS